MSSQRSFSFVLPLLAGALALGACGQDATGPGSTQPGDAPPASTQEGAIVGRIDGGTSSSIASRYSLNAASSAAGRNVAAARIRGDGTLEILATAATAADGSYRIEKVPAGIDRLVVVATSASGAEVGRVIVHPAVAVGGFAAAAPIDGETTVEARVFGELVASGMPKEAVNTIELAQSIDFSDRATAEATVASTADLRALAEGFRARQEIYTQVLASRGISLDADARFAAALPAAVAYAEERRAGADEKTAEAKVSASVADAYRAKGVDSRMQTEASSAAETGLLRAAQVANASAKLDIARAALRVNLLARERLASEALASLSVPAAQVDSARQAIARARAAVDTATTVAGVAGAATTLSTGVQAAFEGHLTQSGRIPQGAQDRLKTALQNLPTQAELETRLGSATSVGAVAGAYTAHFDALRTAVQSAVSQLVASGGNVDGKATAELFTGLRGFVQTP